MQRKRTALITGGARGIGKAIAEKLASCGFAIAINYKTSEAEACELIKSLQSRGVNCIAVQADVSDFRAVEELYAYWPQMSRICGYRNKQCGSQSFKASV